MKLTPAQGKTIVFHNTEMVFKTTLEESGGRYSTILMTHPPLAGPALHLHPDGQETFYVLEGNYIFTLNGETMEAGKGDFISIPAHVPHKYKSGAAGGKVLVTTPPNVEKYFLHIAEKLLAGAVSQEYEFAFAAQNGQVFLDTSEHW